ncbi:MAG: hypothetical protein ACNA8L_02165 [Luteolibacter sp.]|jgi:hypothetical protein
MRTTSFTSTATAAIVALVCSGCASLKFWDRTEAALDDSAATEIHATAEGETPLQAPSVERPARRQIVDDGYRLPDNMLSLPSERDLRRPPPEIANEGNTGVIARPPVGEPKD